MIEFATTDLCDAYEQALETGESQVMAPACGRSPSVLAVAAHPCRPAKRGTGQREIPVTVQGVRVVSGMWVYVDADGVLVALRALHSK
jgi:hypothetical protein